MYRASLVWPSLFAQRSAQIKEIRGIGWGGRIRTCEWRHQKALPYHLATPQQARYASQQSVDCAALL